MRYLQFFVAIFGFLFITGCTTQMDSMGQPTQTTVPQSSTSTRPLEGPAITVTGMGVCLPHKDPNHGTEECAYGIKTAAGVHYALLFNDESLMSFETNRQYTVQGALLEDSESVYNVAGTIDVISLQ